MEIDSSAIAISVATPIVGYVGLIIKRYADSILKMNDTLVTHSQKMAELGIDLNKNKADSETANGKLMSEIDRLRTDLKNAQYAIEIKTEHLEQGLKFVVSAKGTIDSITGNVIRMDSEIQGLTIRANTQTQQMEKVAKILQKLKGV